MSDRSVTVVPPPPHAGDGARRWEDRPPARRQWLLALLTQLLERQLPRGAGRGEEAGHESVPARD